MNTAAAEAGRCGSRPGQHLVLRKAAPLCQAGKPSSLSGLLFSPTVALMSCDYRASRVEYSPAIHNPIDSVYSSKQSRTSVSFRQRGRSPPPLQRSGITPKLQLDRTAVRSLRPEEPKWEWHQRVRRPRAGCDFGPLGDGQRASGSAVSLPVGFGTEPHSPNQPQILEHSPFGAQNMCQAARIS